MPCTRVMADVGLENKKGMSMDHDSGVRGLGGILVGVAVAMIAEHLGMPRWEVAAVALLIGVGLPMAIGGKWKNW